MTIWAPHRLHTYPNDPLGGGIIDVLITKASFMLLPFGKELTLFVR